MALQHEQEDNILCIAAAKWIIVPNVIFLACFIISFNMTGVHNCLCTKVKNDAGRISIFHKTILGWGPLIPTSYHVY